MRRLRLGIVAVMIGAIVALVAGCGGSDPNEAKTPSGAATITNGHPDVAQTDTAALGDATNGEKFFAATCQGCHASGGTVAGVGPVLKGRGLTAAAILKQIQTPKGVMPPNLASGTDLADVVAFVLSIQGAAAGGGGTATTAPAPATPAPAPAPTTPAPATTAPTTTKAGGNAASIAAGKAFFAGACQACHASGGTVAGVGPKLAGAGLTADRITTQVTNGGGAMPPGLASGTDLQNVTNYLLSLQ